MAAVKKLEKELQVALMEAIVSGYLEAVGEAGRGLTEHCANRVRGGGKRPSATAAGAAHGRQTLDLDLKNDFQAMNVSEVFPEYMHPSSSLFHCVLCSSPVAKV